MQLRRARIKNFRSLKDVSVDFGPHTALIGGNGTGKSSILKAVEKFYSTAKSLDADDYFGRNQDAPVEIELTFGNLTPHELETFEGRVRDELLVVTRIFDTSASSGRYYGSVPQNPDFAPIRALSGASAKRDAYKQLRTSNPAYSTLPTVTSATAADDAMLAWESQHPEQLKLERDDGQFFGFQNASRGALQRFTTFVFIPAVREAAGDAADGKGSAIGRLLELLVRSSILRRKDVQEFRNEMTARYQALIRPENMPELGMLASQLTVDLKSLYQDAEVGLQWRQVAELPVPLPTADVLLNHDGFGGPVDRQGHGLQRAFIFTLLQSLARTSAMPTSESVSTEQEAEPPSSEEAAPPSSPNLILAIEEPELYQHPTKQRHFSSVLRNLSSGSLPGTASPTQVIFASHSPMFVSLGKAEEIRLVRRVPSENVDIRRCDLKGLDLEKISKTLEVGWSKEPGTFSAAALTPKLHILGTELSEGFFAEGVVLVEGRSDKAALSATARLLGIDFEAEGIAILSAEGKENLDRPLAIFRELGIPVYVIWDCDKGKKEPKPATNLALLRLCMPDQNAAEPPATTVVAETYAHFEVTLETTLAAELGTDVHNQCLAAACAPFGLTPSNEAQKIPEVMFQTLTKASQQGATSPTLVALAKAIWFYLGKKAIPEPPASPDTADMPLTVTLTDCVISL